MAKSRQNHDRIFEKLRENMVFIVMPLKPLFGCTIKLQSNKTVV